MKWFKDKGECIRALEYAHSTFRYYLTSNNLVAMAENISRSLTTVYMILEDNPEIECYDMEMLTSELAYFEKREVPYLANYSPGVKTLPFDSIEEECQKVIYLNSSKSPVTLSQIENYKIGNRAIGQIYINGEKAFAIKYAIEHSLKSTAKRWLSRSTRLLQILKE